MLIARNTRVVTIAEAAARLGVSVDQMLAWNMVVIHQIDGSVMVPVWSVDPLVARYMPTLSQVFQGEALSYCLSKMHPMGDERDGLEALRDGHWRPVLQELQALRAEFDRVMLETDPDEPLGMARAGTLAATATIH